MLVFPPASFPPLALVSERETGGCSYNVFTVIAPPVLPGETVNFHSLMRGGEKMRRWREFMREYWITIVVSAATTVVFRLLLDWLL